MQRTGPRRRQQRYDRGSSRRRRCVVPHGPVGAWRRARKKPPGCRRHALAVGRRPLRHRRHAGNGVVPLRPGTLRSAEADVVDEVVMTDIIEDKPQGLALDLMQARSIEGFWTRIVGSNGYDETAGSDVCVITAGMPRKPGMSRMDLIETIAKIVA